MADGVIAFLEDLGVDPSDVVTLVIASHMQAETVGEFSQEEFMRGMRSMGVGSVEVRARPVAPGAPPPASLDIPSVLGAGPLPLRPRSHSSPAHRLLRVAVAQG